VEVAQQQSGQPGQGLTMRCMLLVAPVCGRHGSVAHLGATSNNTAIGTIVCPDAYMVRLDASDAPLPAAGPAHRAHGLSWHLRQPARPAPTGAAMARNRSTSTVLCALQQPLQQYPEAAGTQRAGVCCQLLSWLTDLSAPPQAATSACPAAHRPTCATALAPIQCCPLPLLT
jgi:hypothetical protein